MRIGNCWVFAMSVVLAGSALAQSPDAIDRAANNFAHENIVCAAYFFVVGACFKNDKHPDSKTLSEQYLGMATRAYSTGELATKAAGLMPETVKARFDIAVDGFKKDIGGNCANISLVFKHAGGCKSLMEKPEERLNALVQEAEKLQ